MQKETKFTTVDQYLVTVVTTKGVYRFRDGMEYLAFIQGLNPLDVITEEWEDH